MGLRTDRNGPLAYAPLAAVAAFACAVFVGSLLMGAQHIDATERAREEALLSHELPRRLTEIGVLKDPFVLWDEALKNLDDPPNAQWADNNIRTLIGQRLIERVAVLDHADHPIYAAQKRGALTPAGVDALVAAASPLIAQVRAREGAARLPPGNVSISAIAVRPEGRGASVVVATLVRSDTGLVKPIYGRAPILLVQESLERSIRELLGQRYMLANLRTETVSGPAPADRAEVLLTPLDGGRRLVLRWTPGRPGHELLVRSAGFLALAGLLVLVAGAAVALHARNITRELVNIQAETRRLALQDPLTGLANRLLFADRLTQARERLRRTGQGVVGVLCLDLDRFKDVNDTWGHEAGDELIREVARRLQDVARAEDTVARLGGDEFALIARAETAAGIGALADRVIESISGDVRLTAAQVGLSCSVGVTVIGDGDIGQAEALRQADLALYRSKERGRGRSTFFEPEMDAALKARKALESDLRQAVADDALELAYQPLVTLDGSLTGAEALARWTHPERGAINPAVFVPLAEECGLIGALAGNLFRRACLEARRWRPGARLAFNLSPTQLRRPGLIERLEQTLSATGASASEIDLELTEGVLLHDDAKTHEVLGALRGMGFRLVLDDFGTGYSSLSYLHRYPVQKIKLDRTFVARLGVTAEARAIVSALIRMAEALNLRVLAEGVETVAQFDMLRDLGCREFQGFLFARPTTPQAVAALIRDGTRLLPPERAGGVRARVSP